jgi:hypothetical protein
MQGEHEWFLSLMSSDDMISSRKHIPGFPSDTRNPGTVEKGILQAFNLAYNNISGKRGQTQPRIFIRDFYKKCAGEYLKRNKDALKESFESFILNMVSSRVRQYMKVALFFYGYPQEFEQWLPQMLINKKENKPLFEGIINTNLSDTDKMAILLEVKPIKRFFDSIREIEAFAMKIFQEEWDNVNSFMQDAGDSLFYDKISGWEGERRWLGVFSFLRTQDRYKNSEYEKLLLMVLMNYTDLRLKIKSEELENEKNKNHQLELQKAIQQTLFDNKCTEVEGFIKETEIYANHSLEFEEKIASTIKELKNTQINLNNWQIRGELYEQFINLIQEKNKGAEIVFLSDNEQLFAAHFCGCKVTNSVKDIENKNVIIFIDRSAYPSSSKYLDIIQELEIKGTEHVEITGYEALNQLLQVIQFYLEEGEVYE